MRWMAVVGLLGACDFAPRVGGELPGDAAGDAMADGPADSPLDSPPLAACPPAPSGCTVFECLTASTSCYYACATERNWASSRDRCVADNLGCLVTLDSDAENTCVFDHVAPITFPELVWFGFRQADNQSSPEAGWSWQCGTSSFLAGNWGQFEPNDNSDPPDESNRENCGAMGDGGAWIDGGCGTQLRYVCELPR